MPRAPPNPKPFTTDKGDKQFNDEMLTERSMQHHQARAKGACKHHHRTAPRSIQQQRPGPTPFILPYNEGGPTPPKPLDGPLDLFTTSLQTGPLAPHTSLHPGCVKASNHTCPLSP